MNLRRITKFNSPSDQETMENFENKYLNIIESLFTFVLIWVISGFIHEKHRFEAHKIIIEQIKQYRKSLSFKFQNPFGKNFFSFFPENRNFSTEKEAVFFNENLTVFDVIYDLSSESWLLLLQINYPIGQQMSSKLGISSINHQEILRLNPETIQLDFLQKQMKNEEEYLVVLNNFAVFVETPKKKLAKYFLEFLIEYQRNFVVFGENHTGKSSLIQDLYKVKLERNQMNAVMFAVDSKMTIPQVIRAFFLNF